MRIVVILSLLLASIIASAQSQPDSAQKKTDTIPVTDSIKLDSLKLDSAQTASHSLQLSKDSLSQDSATNEMLLQVTAHTSRSDSFPGYNKYGDLLNDNPVYNRRYSVGITAARVIAADVFTHVIDRYVFNYDWSHVNPTTWKNNLRKGWEWDNDKFGVNFIGHPYSGNNYFNIARSNGYNFWQSFPFAVEGSLIWEYFGENTRPSINDIINTPVSGAFLGEVLYRISSNILDDRTRGSERFFRELVAGILNPSRALNRLTQGKMFRVTTSEVYQKEPLNITFDIGFHKVNVDNKFGSGGSNAILNLQLDYGDPFEIRHRKPFDVFRVRIESKYGTDRKLLDNVVGYGLLVGKNITQSHHGTLLGLFQHFDYWNNNIFEIGSLGFGPGLISKLPFATKSNLYSNLHFAFVPLAGNNTRFGPDSSEYRNYNFGGGTEARIDETLNLGNWFSMGFTAYYYWLHTYVGVPGNSSIGILKPKVALKLFGKTSIGFEHSIYYHDRFFNSKVPNLHLVRTEQKLFLQFFLEDPKRYGKYH